MGTAGQRGEREPSTFLLLILFFMSGFGDGMAKVFERIGERQFDGLYLFYTFFTALLLSGILMWGEWRKGKRLSKWDLLGGILVGIPNYFSSFLLLAAVTRLPAYVVYPCFSVGTILVVTLVSVWLLGERLTRQQAAGCGLILAALALLNL